MILSVFRRGHHGLKIDGLYGAIVAQARRPVFYTQYGAADSVDGRFELLVLHLVLVLHRLERDRPGSAAAPSLIGQRLFDAFCSDLDDNLREMGVGDFAVPRRMRSFGEAFYGRQGAYVAALAAVDPGELERALARNIFSVSETSQGAAYLARYVRAAVVELAAQSEDALIAGIIAFPAPEAFANA